MKFKRSILGSMISVAMAAPLVSAGEINQPVDMSTLTEAKSSITAVKGSGIYIVQLKGEPGISQAQATGELLPSNQLVAQGNRYNAKSPRMQAYTNQLKARQTEISSSVGTMEVLHNYVHSFNGFSAKMTSSQAKALENNPNVVSVFEDRAFEPATSSTPDFLGLTSANGQHTLGIKGDDVIVGVLDSGIWPENPSFADDGSYSDPVELGWTGTCDTGEEAEANSFECNNKLIGARYYNESFASTYEIQTALGEFISPRDADGHGSHTASTAAGNEGVTATIRGTDVTTVTGIAPRARVAMYKVCWNADYVSPEGVNERGCFFGDSMAAIDQAIVDGVDVINYSIGNSEDLTTPVYTAGLRAAQAGIFFAASAGNDGPDAATVSNIAPWLTTVAASTHDGTIYNSGVGATIDGEEQIFAATVADFSPALTDIEPVEAQLVIADPLLGCFEEEGVATPLINADQLAGRIALLSRGACAFVEKAERAQLAGAAGVIIYNTDGRPAFGMAGDFPAEIPVVGISAAAGEALNAAISEGKDVSAVLSASTFVQTQEVPNLIADFSSRGVNPSTGDIIKPDITAPGVNILAANSEQQFNGGSQGEAFHYLSGTSMSGPHIAGMAALLRGQYPDWSPAQIKSALMTSARQDLSKEDGETPADPFDFGAGHASPVAAMAPGLTYDANVNDYLAFMCGQGHEDFVEAQSNETCDTLTEAGFSTDASQLNYPSIAVESLLTEETVSRTLTDVSGVGGDYVVSLDVPEGISATVKTFDGEGVETESGNLVVAPNGKASFTITFAKTDDSIIDEWAFGGITFTGADGTVVRSPIAVKPAPSIDIDVPESISLDLNRGRASFPVQMLYSGRTSLDYTGLVAPFGASGTVSQDPDQTFGFNEAGLGTHFFEIPADTKVARFSLIDPLVAQEGADLDLYIYSCVGGLCSQVATSLNGGSNEDIILTNPEPADFYIAWVHGWSLAGAETTDYTMLGWIADQAESTTRVSGSSRAIDGRFNNIRITTRGLDPNLYMGAVTFYNEDGTPQGTTVLEVVQP
ncbi:MAG: S8 family serine peptidase [Paraglaciecola sp.]